MAVLAPPDWYTHRNPAMDAPSSPSTGSSLPITRHRSSPVADTPNPSSQSHNALSRSVPQPPYPYPIQQAQAPWTPSLAAPPFYPSFFHNPRQQQTYAPHPQLNHSSQSHMSSQIPFFDPNSPPFTQWAYQHMMFNAQQGFSHRSPPPQRNNQNTSGDYYAQQAYNPFPSGSPSFPAAAGHRNGDAQASQPQYNGFHPYRRPTRATPPNSEGSDLRTPAHPQPPYAHRDASGSSSSLTSASSQSHNNTAASRQRTNSGQSSKSSTPSQSAVLSNMRSRNGTSQTPPNPVTHGRTSSGTSSSTSSAAPPGSSSVHRIPHNRTPSAASSASPAPPRTSNVSVASNASAPLARPSRPSPLSQGTLTATEKRMSRDDSELNPVPTPAMLRSGGLKGRLRRALAFNVASSLQTDLVDDDTSTKASTSKSTSNRQASTSSSTIPNGSLPTFDESDEPPTPTQLKKKPSLFNARFNMSTDNISLSSTVSSASVMIRKFGTFARRNSLAGITSLFKDKKDGEAASGDSKKGKKRTGKSEASEASVSHVTAELDRLSSGDWSTSDLSGLSPAAELARQHTLKSNAEAAAKAKAQLEAVAITSQRAANGAGTPTTWEKNTTTRQQSPIKRGPTARVNEDGTRVLVEDEDSASDEESDEHYDERDYQPPSGHNAHPEAWDEDDDWAEGEDDEDVTIRVGLERTSFDDEYEEEETITWAVNVRRSLERTRMPTKGILKDAGKYSQQAYLVQPIPTRARSNSFSSHRGPAAEPGPLARIPSPDPDHIDGLHKHPPHSSHSHQTSGAPPTLPPFSFEKSGSLGLDSPKKTEMLRASSPEPDSTAPPPVPEKTLFNHPNYNSSAPALSTMLSNGPPTLTHRSATAPVKRLTFATSLSVYDTFSPTMYDRRSEPATWSRLTPALAQQIKEELNSFKMEEMEVHAASRIHTQFFV